MTSTHAPSTLAAKRWRQPITGMLLLVEGALLAACAGMAAWGLSLVDERVAEAVARVPAFAGHAAEHRSAMLADRWVLLLTCAALAPVFVTTGLLLWRERPRPLGQYLALALAAVTIGTCGAAGAATWVFFDGGEAAYTLQEMTPPGPPLYTALEHLAIGAALAPFTALGAAALAFARLVRNR